MEIVAVESIVGFVAGIRWIHETLDRDLVVAVLGLRSYGIMARGVVLLVGRLLKDCDILTRDETCLNLVFGLEAEAFNICCFVDDVSDSEFFHTRPLVLLGFIVELDFRLDENVGLLFITLSVRRGYLSTIYTSMNDVDRDIYWEA